MIALETLLVFVALMFCVLVYRWLIHSRWFARLVGGVLEVPPESDREVIQHLDQAEYAAFKGAQAAEKEAAEKKTAAAALRKRTRRTPDDPMLR